MANSITERYPDDHPLVRDHRLSIVQDGETTEYVTRDLWEETVAQRDEFRRVLSFISAWRLSSHTHDAELDRLLALVGEDYQSARAMAGLINWGRSEAAKRPSAST
ncbi:hypothetical protein [Mycobacteroides chelonae]|uniref:hypothetical protein n=1 Tax=Mycobacteroides chelonae TaxID=1774 RepID=UPI0008A9B77E|nr:hypothetical protein [Mycobacteroides chelonae]OHU12834.1 hypothetical protein BKG75_17635 [Mycobacteroides chelonae]